MTASTFGWRWVKARRRSWRWESPRRGGLRPGTVKQDFIGMWWGTVNEPHLDSESECFMSEKQAKAWVEARYTRILNQP